MPTNTPKSSKRAPNFLPEEDKQLAKSWVLVSTNPITANQQNKEDFFSHITNDYNWFAPGPQRDSHGLQCRWKNLQRAVLVFCAIHQKIEDNPPSGSSPSNWLADSKQAYYDEEGHQFVFERAWNLLKNKAKFINLANKGKAKNGRRISLASNTLAVSSSPSPAPANCSENPTESVTVGRDVNWKRPAGAKAEKRKIDKSDFRQKKLKLLEKSNNDTALRIAEARCANNIQAWMIALMKKQGNSFFCVEMI
ncbi:hypothetical protein PCASD_18800 [Puccinia coronata f. sp. avenae]|uniref:No apical meristem-associated C-terminal domain-containing protein n=1 Tax=Puccinia coronata f. sp. avenae TaxID=200324 RepID=A0A2N5T9K1_9BASI|nr:hypothetical protein PCASD_18800 [Puccinia coronata f. sp. avenae]